MKHVLKLFLIILIVAIIFPLAPSSCKAAANTADREVFMDTAQAQIIFDDNGVYFVETLESALPPLDSSGLAVNASGTTKTKTKTVKYYNEKNVLCWSYSLTATFNIKLGVSATYKSAKASLDKKSTWSIVSENHSGSGSKATGTIKMKVNSITVSKTVTIQCDKNGKFS